MEFRQHACRCLTEGRFQFPPRGYSGKYATYSACNPIGQVYCLVEQLECVVFEPLEHARRHFQPVAAGRVVNCKEKTARYEAMEGQSEDRFDVLEMMERGGKHDQVKFPAWLRHVRADFRTNALGNNPRGGALVPE